MSSVNYSLFRKGFEQHQQVASGSGDSTAANATTKLMLNKDYLTSKFTLQITSSQASSVAPTGFTPQNCIASLQLEFAGAKRGGNGVRISLSGKELYELMKFVKNTPVPLTTFATPTSSAVWLLDLDLAYARAFNDMMAAAYTAEFSQIKVTINWNQVTTGIFTGGTTSGAVSHAVDVEAYATPVPNTSPGANHEFIATAQQVMQSVTEQPTGAGNGSDVLLHCGTKVRFIQITSYDNTGALSDNIVGSINMIFAGYNFQTDFQKLKLGNYRERNYSSVGTAFIDLGDDPAQWLDLTQLNEARLKWAALAAGTVMFAEVSAKSLEN